jgi:hypothetical protein
MKINPKNGLDKLLFGMKQKDVVALLGKPDKQFEDEENNMIYIYNALQLHLNFYEEEDFRLGYIITANPEVVLLDKKIIGQTFAKVKLPIKTWEKEDFDLAENYFNEDNWLILVSEFDKIVKVELGCMIVNDEFDWKF